MSFSPEWLALREPADHASINAAVRLALQEAVAARPTLAIVDLGCGAGSNLRGLAPALAPGQSWTLVDYDPKLLAAARARSTGFRPDRIDRITYRQADFSTGDFADLLAGADLVTAAALFDLVSVPVIERLAESVAGNRQIFATVLTYDGIAAWLPAHPADNDMRSAFNRHQQGDKGFGAAAGPAATDALAAAFERRGYRIVRGRSPWVLDASYGALRAELDTGWAGAVRETGLVEGSLIDSWLAARLKSSDAVTIVGHEDILALPPD